MKKVFIGVFILVLLSGAFLLGKYYGFVESFDSGSRAIDQDVTQERNLRISVISHVNAGFKSIPLEYGNFKEVTCCGVDNVTIDLDGTVLTLEDALRDGLITVDEMVAQARLDSGLGFCREDVKSENGLTEFAFYYGDFRLYYIYDVFESPDGKEHLIADFAIYGIGTDDRHFYPVDEDTGSRIDYEDWGLSFDVVGADVSGITIKCSQFGGQQLGILNAGCHFLYRKDPDTHTSEQVFPLTEESIPRLFSSKEEWQLDPDRFLTMGGTTELTYDLAQLYGELLPGEYVFVLQLVDCYDKENVSSLMRNFQDAQLYEMEFSIDEK